MGEKGVNYIEKISRKEALRIADQAWDAVDAAALPEESGDFCCVC